MSLRRLGWAALLMPLPALGAGWPATIINAAGVDPARVPLRVAPDAAAWVCELPGPGASTPLVRGGAAYLTCEVDGKNAVIRIGPDGREAWRSAVGEAVPAKHRNASGANPSVATDGSRVYSFFKDTTLAAMSAEDGAVLWTVNVNERFGPLDLWWDLGSSPVVTTAGVAVAVQHAGSSFVATFAADSGEVVWKADRTYACEKESDQAYTTPAVLRIDGREVIVTWGADHVTAHDAANGELVWECGGFNPRGEALWRAIASASIADGIAIVPHGRGDWLAAVRLGETGENAERLLWRRSGVGADVPTPWVADGVAYVLHDKGRVTAVEAATGEERWSDDLPRSRAKHFASPVVVGDVLYTAREDGSVTVSRIDEGIQPVSVGEFEEPIVATPVFWGDDLLVRTRNRLYRVARLEESGP